MTPIDADADPRLKKLKFRAWRRGFREADLILGPFVDIHVQALGPSDLDDLERLLDQPDHDLYGWIIGRQPTPAAYDTDVMGLIKAFHPTAHAARSDLGG